MMFGAQTSMNVYGVSKVFLETSLSVLVCLTEFDVFIFNEIDVRGPKLIYENIRV